MPLPTPHAGGRLRLAPSSLARLLLLLACAGLGHAAATRTPRETLSPAYGQALRLREALEGRAQPQRSRRDYDRVLDAFRGVYRSDPRGPHADASMVAVAELLASEGRLFADPKLSLSSIEQYELVRRQYPASRYRASALLTEGEIYDHDLGDRTAARAIFTQFLREYPQNALAGEARQALAATRGRPAQARQSLGADSRPAGRIHEPALGPAPASAPVHQPSASELRQGGGQLSASSGRAQPQGSAPTAQQTSARGGQGAMVERDLGPPTVGLTTQVGSVDAAAGKLPGKRAPAAAAASAAGTSSSATALSAAAASAAAAPLSPSPPPAETRLAGGAVGSAPATSLNRATLRATGRLPLVTGVRHWSTSVYTRVAIDLDGGDEVQYEASRVPRPDRIFFDLHGVKLAPELIGKAVAVTDGGYLERIRVAQFSNDVVRVVLDVSDVSEYSAFFLPNPSRLIIDIHGKAPEPGVASAGGGAISAAGGQPPITAEAAAGAPAQRATQTSAAAHPPAASAVPIRRISPANAPPVTKLAEVAGGDAHAFARPRGGQVTPKPAAAGANTLGDIATLDRQPDTIRATRSPTTAPVAASVANTTPAPQPGSVLAPAPDLTSGRHTRATRAAAARAASAQGITTADTPAPAIHASELGVSGPGGSGLGISGPEISGPEASHLGVPTGSRATPASSIRAAAPTATGERSMVRALGLKIGRIVVDAGHGGHDSGTLGPGGIEEKDVVLDVALRLGRLLKQRLGADVIYTRDDDTFIPLETRTAIANKAQADLFISVHANSSQDASARGVETYYLNFTTSADALEVAARENAVSDQSIHQLSDLVKKITLQDKISESREFAGDVEQSLYSGLEAGNPGLRDRGVKKAPFVVLIGANMPSILAEISFLTNPDDAHQLRDPEYRQRIAESLYRGVAKYIGSLSGVRLAESGQ